MRILLFAFLVFSTTASAETFERGTLEIQTDSKTLEFDIEIADDPVERSQGLMFREELADGTGMLFLYPTPRIASFWMKNTLIPLDMLFIDAEGVIVTIARETTPLSLVPVSSNTPVTTVFEIFGGQSDALGIAVGDTVQWSETPDEK